MLRKKPPARDPEWLPTTLRQISFALSGLWFKPKRSKALIPATAWMNLENMLSERSQTQKVTYCTTPFTWNTQSSQIHKNRKEVTGCHGLGRGKNGEWCLNGYRASFWSDEIILQLDLCWWLQNTVNILDIINGKFCVFYHRFQVDMSKAEVQFFFHFLLLLFLISK